MDVCMAAADVVVSRAGAITLSEIQAMGKPAVLIPSPNVATFYLKPEMSAVEITDKLLPVLGDYDVIILNYANGDMVGHTGNIDATVCAMETLDAQLARLVPAVWTWAGLF